MSSIVMSLFCLHEEISKYYQSNVSVPGNITVRTGTANGRVRRDSTKGKPQHGQIDDWTGKNHSTHSGEVLPKAKIPNLKQCSLREHLK